MATIALTQSFLDADLSSIQSFGAISSEVADINSELLSAPSFGHDEPTVSGNTYTYKNPTYSGTYGEYKLTGSYVEKFDDYGNSQSISAKYSGLTVLTSSGTIKFNFSMAVSANLSTGIGSTSYKSTSTSYVGSDGSKWSLVGSEIFSYKYNANTESETYSYSQSFKSFSSSDADGNSISLSGSIKYNSNTEEYSGYMTSITVKVNGVTLSSSVKLSLDDLTDLSLGSVSSLLPSYLSGNDTITLSSTDPVSDAVYGYAGNDKITGSSEDDALYGGDGESTGSGNDSLAGGAGTDSLYGGDGSDALDGGTDDDVLGGGAGSDKLTGGKGADIFVFNLDDFFVYKDDGYTIKTTNTDTVADFSVNDGDSLDGFSIEGYYTTLAEAKNEDMGEYVIYETSTGKIYYDPDGISSDSSSAAAVVIVILTGKPDLESI